MAIAVLRHCSLAGTALVACLVLFPLRGLAVTEEEKSKAQGLAEAVQAAGKLYAEGSFTASAEKITAVQKELIALLKSKDPALQRIVKPIYARLVRAHALLELEGAELDALPSWEDLIANSDMKTASQTKPTSFKDEIAPWLISICGNCHINDRRGQFSMATYQNLMQGAKNATVIFAGSSRSSRIVDVVESGAMPPSGAKVAPERLIALKKWIDEGAKFDGPALNAPLSTFVNSSNAAAETELKVRASTGAETISFSKTIAPILNANCQGCHIRSQQASGGLRMDTFAQFLKGGDSGVSIVPSKPAESLLIKKLKGEAGDRMPAGGRPALSEQQIAEISTWIREGATFDGPSSTMSIDTVIDQAWAADASHTALFDRRQERSLARWTRVLPNDQPSSAKSDELFLLGNVPQARVEKLLQQFTSAVAQAKKLLRTPPTEPLVKGGLTVFVLKSRYDYSEFGRMTESRELPQEWIGHWYADPLDAYGVLSADGEVEDKQIDALALQILIGSYLGSFSAVPTWFAEGLARNYVKTSVRRGDERIATWQKSLPAALLKVENAKTLLEKRLDEESAGLVGMGLTATMMDRTNRKRFDLLLDLLRKGQSFDAACTASFAAPEVLIKTWLGK